MQSKISFFNPTIYKQNIKRAWPVALFYMLFLIIELPFALSVELGSAYYYDEAYQLSDAIDIFQISNEVVSLAIAAILIVVVVFSYLYKARHANMMHSFPVSRGAHYGSGFMACVSLLWVAEIVVAAIASVILIMNDCQNVFGAVLVWLGIKALNTVFFVGLAVFCAMFVGQRFSAALLYIILNGLYTGLYLIVFMFNGIFMFGFTNGSLEYYEVFTPLYLLSYRTNFNYRIIEQADGSNLLNWTYNGAVIVVFYAVIGLVFLALGFLAYKYRKVESAGDFLSFDWVKPVYKIAAAGGLGLFISGVCIAVISELFGGLGYNSKFVVTSFIAIVAGFIIFFAVEMLIRRSFRVFNKKQWLIWGIFTIVMIAGLFCIKSDVFGMQRRIPDRNDINYSYIDMNGISFQGDDSEEVLEIHEAIVDRIDGLREEAAQSNHRDYWNNIGITYVTNDNEYIARSYEIYPDYQNGGEIINTINEIFSRPEVMKKAIFNGSVDEAVINTFELSILDYTYDADGMPCYDETYQEYSPNLQQSRQLVHALEEDIDAGTISLVNNIGIDAVDGELLNRFEIWFGQDDQDTEVDPDDGGVYDNERCVVVVLTKDSVNTIRVLCDMLGVTPDMFVDSATHESFMEHSSTGALIEY